MHNLCTVCLARDRRLCKLANLRYIYDCLVPAAPENLPEVQVCWECEGVLRRSKQFQQNALAARDVLLAHTFTPDIFDYITGDLNVPTYSALTQVTHTKYSHTYTYNQEDSSVKNESKNTLDEVKTQITPVEIKIEDEHEIDAPMTPCVIEDPLSDVPDTCVIDVAPPEFTAVDVKLPEPRLVLNKLDVLKPLLPGKELKPLSVVSRKDLPGTSASPVVLKKIKLPEHVAQQIKLLAANNQPVKLRITDDKLRKLVVVNKGDDDITKTAIKPKKIKPKQLKKIVKVTKKVVKDGKVVKKTVKRVVNDGPQKPTSEQIYQRFTNMLRSCISEENRRNVRVRVMTDKEVQETREAMRREPQYLNSEYKCESCAMGYYTQQQLDDHNAAKHTERPVDVKCDVCLAYIPTYMFSFHYGRHRVIYSCLLCDYNMTEPKRVKEHLMRHRKPTETGVYACNVCGIEFSTRHRRKVHKEKEHAPPEAYTCEICGKTFDRRWSWKDHVKRHNLTNEPVECHVCHKTYKSAVSYTMHYRNVHKRNSTGKVRCEECNISFVNLTCLNMHLKFSRKHADPSNFKHICHACGKGFMSERQMKDHIDYVHKGQTEHVCKYCEKMYSTAGGLRKHIKFVHEGGTYEKNKVCTICGKSFTQTAALRQHMNIHTNARPYQCKVCASSFKNHGALYTHYKLKHLKLKKEDKVKISNLCVEGQQVQYAME